MIPLKTPAEIEKMKEGRFRLAKVMAAVLKEAQPGISLQELDQLAESLIKKQGGQPSFKMVPRYKWTTCININQGVVHGIPGKYRLKKSDIVSVDMGMFYKGLHTDESWTILIQNSKFKIQNEKKEKFLKAGERALNAAIKAAKPGNHIGHISWAIEREIKKAGFSPVRALTGHGVGRQLHEEPQIPCYLPSKIRNTPKLRRGMTLAIEVIYAWGKPDLVLLNDGWTVETADSSLSALFERTVFV